MPSRSGGLAHWGRKKVAVCVVASHGRLAGRDRPHGDAGGCRRQHHVPRGGSGGVQPAHRPGDHPGYRPGDRRHAALRHQQQGPRVGHHARPPGGPSRARGCRAPTPRPSSTARSRRRTTPARTRPSPSPPRPSRRLTLLAYDGTAADPVATFASAAETVNRTTHTTPGATVATAGSYVVSYWADKSANTTTGWTLPAGQTQRSTVAGTGAGRINSIASDPNAPRGRRRDPRPHRHQRRVDRQGDDVDRRAPGRPDHEPERRAGGVVHGDLPHGDLHGRRLGLHRHRARHDRVLRVELR